MQTATAYLPAPATVMYKEIKVKKAPMWVDYDFFCLAAKDISPYNKRQIKARDRWRISRKNEIDLTTVPPADRVKYGILSDNEQIVSLIEVLKKQEAERKAERWQKHIDEDKAYAVECGLKIATESNFPQYYNKIKEKYNLPAEKCKLFARRWAAMEWVMENYTRFQMCLETFHSAWCAMFPEQFKKTKETAKHSFKNFHKSCVDNGIENTIVDRRAVVTVQKRRSDFQMTFLQTLYIQNRKITRAEAHKKLVAACTGIGEKPMSEANIKIIFREFEKNTELYKARYGEGAAQKQMPYASLLPAQHRDTQWQVDGWTMPFWGAKFQRYVLYLIRDNHSRKIVGYSIAESENTTLILDALDDAMRNTGVFPGEIVSDKHSFHKTEMAARLRAETEKMGAVWTVTINAQRNQLAERYNQYLDAICKDFAGYLGKNITATNKDARPSPETLAQYAKTANFLTVDEIKAIAAFAITEFNKTPLEPLEGLSPNEKYAQSESLKAFAVSETERIALLRPVSLYKVQRGQIIIKVGSRKHEFQLSAELISRYNNREVAAVWEDLTQGIYISDSRTGEELGCVLPKQKIHGAIGIG